MMGVNMSIGSLSLQCNSLECIIPVGIEIKHSTQKSRLFHSISLVLNQWFRLAAVPYQKKMIPVVVLAVFLGIKKSLKKNYYT